MTDYNSVEKYESMLDSLPSAVPQPCVECPFLRSAVPGHIGPYMAHEWPEMCHAEGPIACHMTIEREGQPWPELKQCAGAAIFRANIFKSPRHPNIAKGERDTVRVFAWDDEFIAHHAPQSPKLKEKGRRR